MASREHLTPLHKLKTNLERCGREDKPLVLLSTGSFCPLHTLHVDILRDATRHLESHWGGSKVVAAFLSPSCDDYVSHKMTRIGAKEFFIPAVDRVRMATLAVEGDPIIAVDPWESSQPGFVDFPAVRSHLQEWLLGGAGLPRPVTVVMVMGVDMMKCGIHKTWPARKWPLALGMRTGFDVRSIPPPDRQASQKLFYFPTSAGDADFSSTRMRALLAEGRPVDGLTLPPVSAYLHEKFGITPVPPVVPVPPAPVAGSGGSGGSAAPPGFSASLLTWNIWFENHRWGERHEHIFRICAECDADVILFQEVTKSFLHVLRKQPWLSSYVASDLKGTTFPRYGVITLCKPHLAPAFQFVDFPTRMERRLLVTTVDWHGHRVAIGNVHLESMNSRSLRIRQLEDTFPVLDAAPHSILAGDFNFSDDWPENKSLPPAYLDVWKALRRRKGYTMPKNVSFPAWRPDHVMLRSTVLRPTSIVLVGYEDLPGACPDCARQQRGCNPSDHYGLFARFTADSFVVEALADKAEAADGSKCTVS